MRTILRGILILKRVEIRYNKMALQYLIILFLYILILYCIILLIIITKRKMIKAKRII